MSNTSIDAPRVKAPRKPSSKRQLPIRPPETVLTLSEQANRIRQTRLTVKPKKPWNRFMQEFETQTQPGEVHATVMSRKWLEIKSNPAEYAKYHDRYLQELQEAEAQVRTLTDEERKTLKEDERRRRRDRRGSVTRPRTSYMLFNKKFHKEVRGGMPGATFAEISRHVSARWNSLTPAEKEAFHCEAREDNNRYKNEVASA